MLYLFLGLKIPLLLLYALVCWAIKAEPEPEDAGDDGGSRKERAAPRPDPAAPPAPRAARRPVAAPAPARAPRGRPRAPASIARTLSAGPVRIRAMPTSVLSDGTIRRLVEEGRIVIEPWDPGLVQPASVDLRLGDSFRVFHNHRAAAIDLREPPTNLTEEVVVAGDEPFVIHPGEFVPRTHARARRAARRHRRPDRGQVEPRPPRPDRARDRRLRRPGLQRHAHARDHQPHPRSRSSSTRACRSRSCRS